jgi:hypothetical protein
MYILADFLLPLVLLPFIVQTIYRHANEIVMIPCTMTHQENADDEDHVARQAKVTLRQYGRVMDDQL